MNHKKPLLYLGSVSAVILVALLVIPLARVGAQTSSQPPTKTEKPVGVSTPSYSNQEALLPSTPPAPPQTSAAERIASDAERTLVDVSNAYSNASSYMDSGVVRTWFIYPQKKRLVEKPFRTVFERHSKLRYEYWTAAANPTGENHYIVWSDGTLTKTWWALHQPHLQTTTLSSAIAGATGVSDGSAHNISALLIPDIVGGRKLTTMSQATQTAGVLDGVDCLVVEGVLDRDTVKTKLWIDSRTHLIRQIYAEHDFGRFRTETTTTYQPTVNALVPAELFNFDPPPET